MPRFSLTDQIDCLLQLEDEAARAQRLGRAALLAAAIRNLKQLDYQQLEEKRKARREKRVAASVDEVQTK